METTHQSLTDVEVERAILEYIYQDVGGIPVIELSDIPDVIRIKGVPIAIYAHPDSAGNINVNVKSEIPVEKIRLGRIPGFADPNDKSKWSIRLELFSGNDYREFRKGALFIQLSNGYRIKSNVPFPVYKLHWKQERKPTEQQQQEWEEFGRTGTPRMMWFAAADDGRWSRLVLDFIQSNDNIVDNTPRGRIHISRMGNEQQELIIRIEGGSSQSPDVVSVQLGGESASRCETSPTDWTIPLRKFSRDDQNRLLDEQPLIVHCSDCDIEVYPPQ